MSIQSIFKQLLLSMILTVTSLFSHLAYGEAISARQCSEIYPFLQTKKAVSAKQNKFDYLSDLKKLGIQYQSKQQRIENGEYILDIIFPSLNFEQFQFLREKFGSRTYVQFVPGQHYLLTDFLSPMAQALVNKTYKTEYYSFSTLGNIETTNKKTRETLDSFFPLQKNGVEKMTNCWGTVLELIKTDYSHNAKLSYDIYWMGRWEATDLFQDNTYSSRVYPADVQTGDVILFFESTQSENHNKYVMLQHAAYVVTKDLVFEKTDTGSDQPFRSAWKNDVIKKFKKIFKNNLHVEYRRFHNKNNLLFQKPFVVPFEWTRFEKNILRMANPSIISKKIIVGCESGMGGGCDQIHSIFTTIKIQIDADSGRGTLDQKSPEFLSFKNVEFK
jgi:hypothetical protein